MSTFAVTQIDGQPAFRVSQCHINFWSLAGLLGRRRYYVDIGLLVDVEEAKALDKIGLLLPFGVDPASLTNLGRHVLDHDTARLIFGTTCTIAKQVVTTGPEAETPPFTVVNAHSAAADPRLPIPQRRPSDYPVALVVSLGSKVRQGKPGYVRFRLPIPDPGRTWVWGKSKRSVVVDFRVGDIREIVHFRQGRDLLEELSSSFVPINRVNLFVVAPSWLQYVVASPECRYIRSFEGKVWEPYLDDRAVDWHRSDKLVLYHLRHDGEIDTSDGRTPPFRAFLLLHKEARLLPLAHYLIVAIAVAVAIPMVAGIETQLDWKAADLLTGLSGFLAWVTTLLASLGIGALWILSRLGRLPGFALRAAAAFRTFEDGVFRFLRRIGN